MKQRSELLSQLSAIITGAAGGVVMAGVLLGLLRVTGYEWKSLSFLLITLARMAMPLCLDPLRRRGIDPAWAEIVMIVLSAAICFGYVRVSAVNRTASERMNLAVALIHAASLLGYTAQFFVSWLNDRSQKEQ